MKPAFPIRLALLLTLSLAAMAQVTLSNVSLSNTSLSCLPTLPAPPTNAYTYANLQNATVANAGALSYNNGTTTGSSSCATGTSTITTGVASPSLSGAALEFQSDSTTSACLWNSLLYRHLNCTPLPGGVCTGARNFLLDMYVYFASGNSSLLQAYEFDPDQYTGTFQLFGSMQFRYLPSGQRFLYLYSKTPSPGWVATSYTMPSITEGTWHHIQLYLTMDPTAASPTVTYQTFLYDGVPVFVNLGYVGGGDSYIGSSLLNTEFQLDGNGTNGTLTEYVDDWNLSVWGLSQPTASPAPGTYSTAQSVALSAPVGTICYTTDGSTPTATSGTCTHGTTYSSPISVSTTTTIKAITTYAGNDNSDLFTGTYTISGATPAVSISPSSIAEGSVLTNTTTYFQLVTVTNTGTANLTFSGIGFTGTDASDFAITSGFSPSINPVGGNTLPLCQTTQSVAPSASCIVPVEFVPGASGSRSASLQFTDNASGSPHTVSLTGTGTSASGTVLTSSNCNTNLSGSTTYYLSGDVTCNGSGFGINGSNIVVNLNGHTLTVGASPSSAGISSWAFYSAQSDDQSFTVSPCIYYSSATQACGAGTTPTTSNVANFTLENGTVVLASSAVSQATSQGGSAVLYAGSLLTPSNIVMHDLTVAIPLNCISCQVIGGYQGSANTYNGPGDRIWKTTVNDNSGQVLSRCEYEGAAYLFHNNAGTSDPGPILYENTINHTPQDGFAVSVDHAYIFGNTIAVGNPNGTSAGTSSTCSGIGTNANGTQSANDFAVGAYGSYTAVVNNIINNLQGRGIDLTTSNTTVSTYASGNSVTSTDIPNYVEYSGCQLGGGYGERINNFGVTGASGYHIDSDTVTVSANQCTQVAVSLSSNSNTSNYTNNVNETCTLASGHATGINCFAFQDNSQAYGSTEPFLSQNDTYTADTADITVSGQGGFGGPWTCIDCTFVKPATATAGECGINSGISNPWNVFSFCYPGVGGSGTVLGPLYIVNPTFTGGASASSDDMALATVHMGTGTVGSRFIQYTYQVTVTGAVSGNPIAGATVTATDTHSGLECTATTNSSGVAICNGQTALSATNAALNNTEYSFTAPSAPVTTNFNPFSFSITKSGCTTNTYSETITGAVTETKTLNGC